MMVNVAGGTTAVLIDSHSASCTLLHFTRSDWSIDTDVNRYIGRPVAAATATGNKYMHKNEFDAYMSEAFN